MVSLTALVAILPFLGAALAAPLESRYHGVVIQAQRDGECITPDVSSASQVGDGTAVVSKPCAQALPWDVSPGSGSIVLHNNPGFALDAGSAPGNNGALKVWTSYPGLYQQTWYLTNDNRIAITGGTQCLDEGDNGVQTYQCTTGNTNQIFMTPYKSKIVGPAPSSAKPSSTAVHPSATSSSTKASSAAASATSSYVEPDPCYGSGGTESTYTSNGVVTSTLLIATPSCRATQTA